MPWLSDFSVILHEVRRGWEVFPFISNAVSALSDNLRKAGLMTFTVRNSPHSDNCIFFRYLYCK